jgi:hypothetical protein
MVAWNNTMKTALRYSALVKKSEPGLISEVRERAVLAKSRQLDGNIATKVAPKLNKHNDIK